MDDRVVTFAEFGNSLDAQMAKSSLESNGLKATIVGENLKGLLPADGMLNVQLKVFAKDLAEAGEIPGTQFEREGA